MPVLRPISYKNFIYLGFGVFWGIALLWLDSCKKTESKSKKTSSQIQSSALQSSSSVRFKIDTAVARAWIEMRLLDSKSAQDQSKNQIQLQAILARHHLNSETFTREYTRVTQNYRLWTEFHQAAGFWLDTLGTTSLKKTNLSSSAHPSSNSNSLKSSANPKMDSEKRLHFLKRIKHEI